MPRMAISSLTDSLNLRASNRSCQAAGRHRSPWIVPQADLFLRRGWRRLECRARNSENSFPESNRSRPWTEGHKASA
jgi:hypothetical protein